MAAASTIAVITAAGAALSAVKSIQQGKAAQAQANFQAAVQNQQAELQRQQAARARRLAAVEEAQLRRQQARDLASARARLAAGGRDIASGTALLLQEDAAAQNEFAALLERSMGLERPYAFENQANLSSLDASRLRLQGAAVRRRSNFEAGSSLLGGAVTFAEKYPWG
jgi:hypothetical protein